MARFLLLLALFSVTAVMISAFQIRKARNAANDRVEIYCAESTCDLCTTNTDTTSLKTELQSNSIGFTQRPINTFDVSGVEQNQDIQALTDCTESIARCYKDGILEDDFDVTDISSLKQVLQQSFGITLN